MAYFSGLAAAFSGLKGLHSIAQGNALGWEAEGNPALKGRNRNEQDE